MKIAIGVATCLGLYWWLIWSRNSLAVIASAETKSDKIFFSVNCSKDFDDDPFEGMFTIVKSARKVVQ